MKASLLKATRGRKGSALLIILAFVLLLAIITTAFLSRAMLDKTVSTASSDQTRTDIFASGAIDAILSDFQQEIAAGSTGTTTSGTTIYMPVTAQDIVPSRTWTGTITQPNPLPNLIKRSACALKFYPTGDPVNYPNASSYPPNEQTFTSADSNDSTATASLNGRSYSSVRWNQALLLPKATLSSSTDYTPTGSFTPPDWILVQRDGTNPTVFSSTLTVPRPGDVTTINKNPVVGRYAYTVYDEGGLLDANVAGFPSGAFPAPTFTQKFYRTSEASVDLTQLTPITYSGSTFTIGSAFFPGSGNPPSNSIVNALVGWRNFNTLQASGTIPSYTFPGPYVTNYFLNVLPPNSGFLHTTVANNPTPVTSITNGQSDRKFASRQQLISIMLNDIAQSTADKVNIQNALQYIGTFTRGLSQPSYTPDSGRPMQVAGSGTDPASSGGNAAASDDINGYINVPFASTLVQTSYVRSDGSTANVGEPLVKKRFALNRLAWLTYLGPIADDSGNYTSGLTTLISTLKTQYGFTDAFLKLGGPSNIQKYFGLLWAQDANDNNRYKWFYNGSASAVPADGATFANNHTTTSGGLSKITELGGGSFGMFSGNNAGPHDPDFFELIKAAILAGSKAKTLVSTSAANFAAMSNSDALHPLNVQYNSDVSLDCQVLQIGANIIDQSRIDGYTTEIVFDNGAGNGQFVVRGVENYPYLYRVREGAMTVRKINPATAVVPDSNLKDGLNQAAYPTFTDTGVAAMMQVPEIWNPHDVNAPMGSPYPTYFRVVMDTTAPTNLTNYSTPPAVLYSSISVVGEDTPSGSSGTDSVTLLNPSSNTYASAPTGTLGTPPTFSTTPSGTVALTNGFAGENQVFTPANTAMTFRVPSGTIFREPTILSRPNVPYGSSLALGWTPSVTPPNTLSADLVNVQNSAGSPAFVTGSGLLSDTPNPLNLPTAPSTSQTYIGFILGLYPIQWVHSFGASTTANNYVYDSTIGHINGSPNTYFTLRMQYADPVLNPTGLATLPWVTYDVKYITPKAKWPATPSLAGPGNIVDPNRNTAFYGSDTWVSFADPRSSRFGAPGGDNNGTVTYYSQPGNATQEWLDQANGVLYTDRPDHKQGFDFESYRTGDGWYLSAILAPGWSSTQAAGYSGFRWGPISQNMVATTTDATTLRYTGDGGNNTGAFQPFYYADPDGVVRRAMGGLVPLNSATAPPALYGYPMATATTSASTGTSTVTYNYTNGTAVTNGQSASRPFILKRPFRTVGELGYVFSGTPWKNLDFTNPESGDSALLDVFCINDTDDPNGLVAGRVNLNSQQVPVLAAILAEANYDDSASLAGNFNGGTASSKGPWIGSSDTSDAAYSNGTSAAYSGAPTYLASWLVNGPQTSLGTIGSAGTSVTPLMNVRELVGKWNNGSTTSPVDGTSTANYKGFSADISKFYNPAGPFAASYNYGYETRFHEAAVRALSAVGETRVWNLMIDVVAQTGRYPSTATNAANFLVEGERRYWVHVAIDRYTGKILDRQIEEVRQ